jgi:hypothetical protein
MSGTLIYWNAMLSFLPQIADRTEPLDVPPLNNAKAREFIGRRIAYAQNKIDSFNPENFSIYPFMDSAVEVMNTATKGNPRDIRMLARGCQQVAAENLRNSGSPEVTKEIAELVSEAYATLLREVQ